MVELKKSRKAGALLFEDARNAQWQVHRTTLQTSCCRSTWATLPIWFVSVRRARAQWSLHRRWSLLVKHPCLARACPSCRRSWKPLMAFLFTEKHKEFFERGNNQDHRIDQRLGRAREATARDRRAQLTEPLRCGASCANSKLPRATQRYRNRTKLVRTRSSDWKTLVATLYHVKQMDSSDDPIDFDGDLASSTQCQRRTFWRRRRCP